MAVKQHRLMWAPGHHSLKGAALPLPTEHSLADQGAPGPATEPLLSSIRGHTCPPLKERDQVLLSWCHPQVGNGPQNPCQQGCCRHSLWLSHFAGGRVTQLGRRTGNPWHKEDPGHMDAALAGFFFFFNADCRSSQGFPGGSAVKKPPANAGDVGFIPRLGRSSGRGNGNPF